MVGNQSFHGIGPKYPLDCPIEGPISKNGHLRSMNLCVESSIDVEEQQSDRKLVLYSGSDFSMILENTDEVFIVFLSKIARSTEYNFTHISASGDSGTVQKGYEANERLLDEMEKYYPYVFEESTNHITANHNTFETRLVDPAVPPPKRNLYYLSDPLLEQ